MFKYNSELKMLFLAIYMQVLSMTRIENNWLSFIIKVPFFVFWFWLFGYWFGERAIFREIVDNLKHRGLVGINSKGEIIEY